MPPKVTVYIVNHNYEAYLEEAIESVLAQTLQDIEILIIDDGSSDGSREIIKRYEQNPKVFAVYQQNKGLNVTNNIALRMAQGEYIMRLDADDYIDSNALAVMAGVLDRENDIGLVFPDYYMVDVSGKILQLVRRHDFAKVQLLDQPAHGACTLIRRNLLQELGGYDESFQRQDGYELWIRFVRRYEVTNVNLPLFYYRQHAANMTSNQVRLLETRNQILRKHAQALGREKKTVGVIAIRGTTSDPHSVALRKLGDRTVIDWTIECAMKAERLSDIIVTTPDQTILAYVARTWSGKVIPLYRDPQMAEINKFVDETVLHALNEYKLDHETPEYVAILPFEVPFRRPEQIDSAIDVMEIFDTDRVVSVRSEVGMLYQHKGNGMEPLRSTRNLWLESNDLYRDAGVVSAIKTRFLEEQGEIYGGTVGHIIVDEESAIALESELQWELASMIASRYSAGQDAVIGELRN